MKKKVIVVKRDYLIKHEIVEKRDYFKNETVENAIFRDFYISISLFSHCIAGSTENPPIFRPRNRKMTLFILARVYNCERVIHFNAQIRRQIDRPQMTRNVIVSRP